MLKYREEARTAASHRADRLNSIKDANWSVDAARKGSSSINAYPGRICNGSRPGDVLYPGGYNGTNSLKRQKLSLR
jgi:hypothetical protein